MEDIVIATNNEGKVKELKKIFKEFNLLTLKDINLDIEVKEDGVTFEENAIKKAKEISEVTGKPCIADDSGICIDAFDGWPGVMTARFLGKDATSRMRNEYILRKFDNSDEENREASFICVLAYCDKDNCFTEEGIINGKIAEYFRGENGFGFDEIFETENGKTLAEMSDDEKNEISARKKAAKKIAEKLHKM